METNIKTLETSLAERNAAIRILQSKNSSSNLSVNNIDEFISTKMAAAAAANFQLAELQIDQLTRYSFPFPN